MKKWNRWLAGVLAAGMLMSSLPFGALAQNPEPTGSTAEIITQEQLEAQSESTEPSPVVTSADPEEPVQPEESANPEEPTQPEESAAPVESVAPVEPTQTVEPTDPAETPAAPIPSAPTEPEESASPVEPTETAEPTETQQPTLSPEELAAVEQVQTMIDTLPTQEDLEKDEDGEVFLRAQQTLADIEKALEGMTDEQKAQLKLDRYNELNRLLQEYATQTLEEPADDDGVTYYNANENANKAFVIQKVWNDNQNPDRVAKMTADTFFGSLQLQYLLEDGTGNKYTLTKDENGNLTANRVTPGEDGKVTPAAASELLSKLDITLDTNQINKNGDAAVGGMGIYTYTYPDDTMPKTIKLDKDGTTTEYTVVYSVAEPIQMTGYLPAEHLDGDPLALVNTLEATMQATVEWQDNGNYYQTRPTAAQYRENVTLWRQVGGGEAEIVEDVDPDDIEITESGNTFTITVKNQPAYDDSGRPCVYSLQLPEDSKTKQQISTKYYPDTSDPGGLYENLITNQGNFAQETNRLYNGGTVEHTLTHNFVFQANKTWVDNGNTDRPAATLYLYRIAENTADTAKDDSGSVTVGSNIKVDTTASTVDDRLIGTILDKSDENNPKEIATITYGEDGLPQITDKNNNNEPVGAWYSDGTVRYTDGNIIGTLDAQGNLIGAVSGHIIGRLVQPPNLDQPIPPTSNVYEAEINFFATEGYDFKVVRIDSGSLLTGSPTNQYNNVELPTSVPTENSDKFLYFSKSENGITTWTEKDDEGGDVTYKYDEASKTFTVWVGEKLTGEVDANGNLVKTKELPMYDAQGRRYIYYAIEVMEGTGADTYVTQIQNPSIYRPDTITAAGSEYLLNGGSLTNKLSEPVTVKATKTFEAPAIQEMPTTKVTMALQKRVKVKAGEQENEWEFDLLDNVPLDKDKNPVTDENGNPLFEKVLVDGTPKYRRVVTLTDFRGESMTKTGSLTVDKYDENGNELEYRWVETSVMMKEANHEEVTATAPESAGHYYDTGDVITLQPEDEADNIIPGVENERTTAQFKVTVQDDGTVTNKLVGETQVELTKTWLDNDGNVITQEYLDKNPNISKEATFHLYQNGQLMPGKDVELDLEEMIKQDKTSMTYLWDKLPRYDENGHEYVYTIEEEGSTDWIHDLIYSKEVANVDRDGKTIQITQTNASVTNQPVGNSIIIDVKKEWLDDGDLNCRLPIQVTLYDKATGESVSASTDLKINGESDGSPTRTITAEGNWETRFILSGKDVENKTAANYFVLEDGLVLPAAAAGQTLEVDYSVHPEVTGGTDAENRKALINYLEGNPANKTESRLALLSSRTFFENLTEEDRSINLLTDLLAGHLAYGDSDIEEAASHYYNVYIGQEADTNGNDRHTTYVLYNQRTGIVKLKATKTWRNGGDILPIELTVSRTDSKSTTPVLHTITLDPTHQTPDYLKNQNGDQIKDQNGNPIPIGYTMTWESETVNEIKGVVGYTDAKLKPKVGYPKYDFMGRLLTYSIRETAINGIAPTDNKVTIGTDTYQITSVAQEPYYGDSRHSEDLYAWNITNQKTGTYNIQVRKVWQDDGTSSKLNHQNDQARPDPVFTIYRTSYYTATEVKDIVNRIPAKDNASADTSVLAAQLQLVAKSQVVAGSLKWDTKHNDWYWSLSPLKDVDQYDENGRPYTYFMIESMHANSGSRYQTFYYNATDANGSQATSFNFRPQVNLTQGAIDALRNDKLTPNGDTYTDEFGNEVSLGADPTSTEQVFAPNKETEANTSAVALIISDGVNQVNGSYTDYWSGTTVNYRADTRNLTGEKIWSGLPNTGTISPSTYLPELVISLHQSYKDPETVEEESKAGTLDEAAFTAVLGADKKPLTKTVPDPASRNYGFDFGYHPRYDDYGQRIYYYVKERFKAKADAEDEGNDDSVDMGGYGENGLSILPHNNFSIQNVYDGQPYTDLTIEKKWPGFNPDTGKLTEGRVEKELPEVTTFKLESIMPGVDTGQKDENGDPIKDNYLIDEYTRYIRLTVKYTDPGYTVKAEVLDQNGNVIEVLGKDGNVLVDSNGNPVDENGNRLIGQDGKLLTGTENIGVKVTQGKYETPDPTYSALWTIEVSGLRGYAPNGQRMTYRISEVDEGDKPLHGYEITASHDDGDYVIVVNGNKQIVTPNTSLTASVSKLLARAFSAVRSLFQLQSTTDDDNNGDNGTTTSAGTATYTNTYDRTTVDFTINKAWYRNSKYNWSQDAENERKTSVTVVLCRQWWSYEKGGEMLNEVVLKDDGTPQTAVLEKAENYQETFAALAQYAPNGNAYRYYVIEHPDESPSYHCPDGEQKTIKFENLPTTGNDLSYGSSNAKLGTITITNNAQWCVSGNYITTEPTAAPKDSDTLTNKLPLTSIQFEKTWYVKKDGDAEPLRATTNDGEPDADFKRLCELGVIPYRLHLDVERKDPTTGKWLPYAEDLGYYTLSNIGNFPSIHGNFPNSLPKYLPGCNGTDHDGCQDTNDDGKIDHKVAEYRIVERLEYYQGQKEDEQPTFPNKDTKKKDTGEEYKSELKDIGEGKIGPFDSTVVRNIDTEGVTTNTFTNTLVLRPLRIDKVWDDNTNKDNTRPDTLDIKLYRLASATGDLTQASKTTVTLGYGSSIDTEKNHWATLVWVPLYTNTGAESKQYSYYMVAEGESEDIQQKTLIKSDGTRYQSGDESDDAQNQSGDVEILNGTYKFVNYESGHTITTGDGTTNNAATTGGADTTDDHPLGTTTADSLDLNIADPLDSNANNLNYFLFRNKLPEEVRRTLTTNKESQGDGGWENLTRPAIQYTLQFYNEGSTSTDHWQDANPGNGITGVVKVKKGTEEFVTDYQIVVKPNADGTYPAVEWEANAYYPKAVANNARVVINYRVKETMGYLDTSNNNAFVPLQENAPYTGSRPNASDADRNLYGSYPYYDGYNKWGSWGQYSPESTNKITNTLRTVELNLTKTWEGDSNYVDGMRPNSVTYLVQYRRAKVTETNGTISLTGWEDGNWQTAPIGPKDEQDEYTGTITLDATNTDKTVKDTWTLNENARLKLPLFDNAGNMFIYRVAEKSITYVDNSDPTNKKELVYEAVNQTGDDNNDRDTYGFKTPDTNTDNSPKTISTWDGTVGGYTGHVETKATWGANGIPEAWYAGGGEGTENTNTFETNGLTVEKKVAADNYATPIFAFKVEVTLPPAAAPYPEYAWTVVCQNKGHVTHNSHTETNVGEAGTTASNALHGKTSAVDNVLTIEVNLGHGDKLYVHHLPEGAKYTVTETPTVNGLAYTPTFTVNGTTQSMTSTGDSVTISQNDGLGASAEEVLCVNRLASVVVVKQDGGGSPLAGAEFTLYQKRTNTSDDGSDDTSNETPYGDEVTTVLAQKVELIGGLSNSNYDSDTGHVKETINGVTKEYTVHKETDAQQSTKYFYYKLLDAPLNDKQQQEYLASGTVDGKTVVAVAEFQNLPIGTYTLKETAPPDGYLCSQELTTGITFDLPNEDDNGDHYYNVCYDVINYKGMALPTTGSGGVCAPVALGLVLFTLALVLLLYQCRPQPAGPAVSAATKRKKKKGDA